MERAALLFIAPVGASLATPLAHGGTLKVKTDQVVGLTRFLEERPLDESAPAIRSLLVDWEEKSKDVVDYVCPGVLEPIPAEDVPNSAELLVQFIFWKRCISNRQPKRQGESRTRTTRGNAQHAQGVWRISRG